MARDIALNRLALNATVHCLTGCAIGEVLGTVIGTALRWSNSATVALSVVLAFFFGYALTIRPLRAAQVLIQRGRGHALVHEHHRAGSSP